MIMPHPGPIPLTAAQTEHGVQAARGLKIMGHSELIIQNRGVLTRSGERDNCAQGRSTKST